LSLHDALPISRSAGALSRRGGAARLSGPTGRSADQLPDSRRTGRRALVERLLHGTRCDQALVFRLHPPARGGQPPRERDDALGTGAPALRATALPAAAPAARPLAAGGPRHRPRPCGLLYASGFRRRSLEIPDLVAAGRHVQPGARYSLAAATMRPWRAIPRRF